MRPHTQKWDILLPVNWEDLRLLAIWADTFARKSGVKSEYAASFVNLLDHIRQFKPEGAPGLTLYEDAEDARKAGADTVIIDASWGGG